MYKHNIDVGGEREVEVEEHEEDKSNHFLLPFLWNSALFLSLSIGSTRHGYPSEFGSI